MRLRTATVLFLLNVSLCAAARELVFSDDFNGRAIDAEKWNVVTAPGNAAQHIEGCYTPEGVQVRDGALHLLAEKLSFTDRRTGRPCNYRAGRVESKFSFQYGRLEFRARLPRGRSYWPALWVRTRPSDGPIADEIDVIEGFGSRPGAVQSTLHLWDNGKRLKQWCAIVGTASWKKHCASSPQVVPAGTDFSVQFHDWAVEWAPGKVTWFLDGKEYFSTSEYSPTRPMVIVMNVAVGGSFDGPVDGTTPFPMEMAVDSVRVYRDVPPSTVTAMSDRCRGLASLPVPNTAFTASEPVALGTFAPPEGTAIPNLPGFCRVAATLTPSKDSSIRVELWLPERWNKRFLGTGNGGFAGKIGYGALAGGVRTGYAVANTDMGMATPPGKDASVFVGRPERWKDWGYRATHEMTAFSKRIVAAYYGTEASRSYFTGCSTGGEQALMEAQRFPDDYDGIVAGAAANHRTRLHAAILWSFASAHRDPSANIAAAKIPALTDAVTTACGEGKPWIDDPRSCNFDPASLQCKGEAGENCLSAAEVETVRRIYAGPVNPRTGERIYPGVPVGSEFSWPRYYLSAGAADAAPYQAIFQWVFGAGWKWRTFDYDRDMSTVDERLAADVNATSPDLSAFRSRDHKLIAYHGWADALVMPGEAIRYYDSVSKHFGSAEATRPFYRLFMVPGMGHCSGGPGPSQFDMLSAVVEWVEKGTAPERVTARAVGDRAQAMERPLCPYPQAAQYVGSGDKAKADSYACVSSSAR
jgi:feruloyl esterase